MFTLVGGGMKKLEDSYKPMEDVLPVLAKWVKDKAAKFDPKANKVMTKNGDVIEYEYMVVATGLQLNYDKVELHTYNKIQYIKFDIRFQDY